MLHPRQKRNDPAGHEAAIIAPSAGNPKPVRSALPGRRQRLHFPRVLFAADRDDGSATATRSTPCRVSRASSVELLERSARAISPSRSTSGSKSFRSEIYPAYKANRDPAPPELRRPVRAVPRALPRLRRRGVRKLPVRGRRHHRHDRGARPGGRRAGHDREPRQGPHAAAHGPDMYWDAVADIRYEYGDIEERFGVRPERIADFLALTGDSVDNIPGVPGIGRKTGGPAAQALRHAAGRVRQPRGIAELKFRGASFVAQSLRDHRESAFLSRQLTGIACDMPIEAEVDDLGRRVPDLAARRALLRCAGLRAHAARAGAAHRRSGRRTGAGRATARRRRPRRRSCRPHGSRAGPHPAAGVGGGSINECVRWEGRRAPTCSSSSRPRKDRAGCSRRKPRACASSPPPGRCACRKYSQSAPPHEQAWLALAWIELAC